MLKNLAALTAAIAILLAPLPASALETDDLLALVAMPLAVAAVSEMTDVPMNDLIDVVTLLNDAAVPPVQFVEVVRYVPVALVTVNEGPTFVEFLRQQEREGIRGLPLVNVIETRFVSYGVPDLDFDRTRTTTYVIEDEVIVPQIVRTRVVEAKRHPHGGPPGQLKKERGVQTGAEIVHGTVRDRDDDDDRRPKQQARGIDRDDKPGKSKAHKGGGKDDHKGGKGKAKGKDKG